MAESVLNQEEQKLDSNNAEGQIKARNARIFRIAGVILSVVMLILTAYVFKAQQENNKILMQTNEAVLTSVNHMAGNYRSYVTQYKDTKAQLEETTRKLEAVTAQLNDVSAQLETTKGLLNQTQTMLTQAQSENNKLKEELQGLDGIKLDEKVQDFSQLEAKIAALKSKNNQTANELTDLRAQLKAFQADFSTVEEGRSLITLFQNKIKLVKSRMTYLAQEAYFAKIAAQKERDRLATLNGNNGFMLRNGSSPKSGNKSFSIDVKMVQ